MARNATLKRALAVLGVVALLAAAGVRAEEPPEINPERCAQIVNAEPPEPLLERESCSVCQLIVDNANTWNWGQHYSALCTGIPAHAREWVRAPRPPRRARALTPPRARAQCEYYACKLAECEFFKTGRCKVIRSRELRDVVEMSPCPAKYLCSYCLQVPRTQVFGCFDDTSLI